MAMVIGGCLLAHAAAGQEILVKGRIEGTILNQTTGQVLSKATVTLKPVSTASPEPGPAAKPRVAISDTEGKFGIEEIVPGRYTLATEHPGYARLAFRHRGSRSMLVEAGGTVKGLRLEMMPFALIAGRVLDEEGAPRTEVQVQAFRYTGFAGKRRLAAIGTRSNVDDQGSFRIANLEPGDYTLSAKVNAANASGTDEELSYVTTYHPSAVRISESAPISLGAGAEAHTVIRLRKSKAYSVQGKVVDGSSGEPIRNLLLTMRPERDSEMSPDAPMSIVRNGTFEFAKVLPGPYWIEPSNMVVMIYGREPLVAKRFGRQRVTIADRNIAGLVVRLEPGATVSGSVKAGDAAQTPASSAESSTAGTVMTLRLTPENQALRSFSAKCESNGAFEAHDVAPERYYVSVAGLPEGSYARSIRLSGRDFAGQVLDLTSGGHAVLEVDISSKAGSVTGVVRDEIGEPSAATVTLAPMSRESIGDPSRFRLIQSEENGSFTIDNLPPGEYRILAWEAIEPGLAADPDFHTRFESASATLKLDESSRKNVDLRPVPSKAIQAETGKVR